MYAQLVLKYLLIMVLFFPHGDHQLVYTVRKATKCVKGPSRNIEARSYRNFDVSAFLEDLNQIPWCTIEVSDNPDIAWSICEGPFVPICDKHISFKNMKNSKKAASLV